MVNTLEEAVKFDGGDQFYLSTHRYYRDVYHPDGVTYLSGFGQKGNQVWWAFKLAQHLLVKRLYFGREREFFEVQYSSPESFTLEVRPLLSFRIHHDVVRVNQRSFTVKSDPTGAVTVREASWPIILKLVLDGGRMREDPCWYYNFYYAKEEERGSNYIEDLYSVGVFTATGTKLVLRGWIEPVKTAPKDYMQTPLSTYLAFSPHPIIVAGYYWFWDWCRDTMIVLPTLYESTGDIGLVTGILDRYFAAEEGGFLPTGFDEAGNAFYNSVDTSLWAAYAVNRICVAASSWALASRYASKFESVWEGYEAGNMLGVKIVDGLVYHGSYGATWMDAYYDGVYYTPRSGFAVEVNALWLLLLKTLYQATANQGDRAQLDEDIQRFKRSFNTRFQAPFGLYDTLKLDFEASDPSEIRPNMLFAISLHSDLVDESTAHKILSEVRRKLLTPFGLRTLNPGHPNYKPRYNGDRRSRDAAYHNGTVWPWLLGAYFDACIRYEPHSVEYSAYVIRPLVERAQLHNQLVDEVFDAEPPHAAGGCPAQAWSTSELIRIRCLIPSVLGVI